MGDRRCRAPLVVDNSVLIWNERPNLSSKRKGEIMILAAMKYLREIILSPTRMKKAGLADFLTPSSYLKRKLDDLDDSEGWVDETIRAMALHSRPAKVKSSEGSLSGKGLSSTTRSRQTRSDKGKTSTLTLDDVIKPVRTPVEFATKSMTSDSATKVIGSSPIRALDKAASFDCLVRLYLYKCHSYLPGHFCAYM
ncbi:hypothetical protein ACOSP7_003079 [Xanthoceras sorbifolium]